VKNYLVILPIALLVTCSQLIVKWLSDRTEFLVSAACMEPPYFFGSNNFVRLPSSVTGIVYLAVRSYTITVDSSIPVYMGITFVMVLFRG
jgi:hypothetical protein